MKKAFLLSCMIMSIAGSSSAQLLSKLRQDVLNVGFEYNYYPAGHMLGLQLEKSLWDDRHDYTFSNPHHTLNFRLGVNLSNRSGMTPVNDTETGWGPGISLGYRYYLSKSYRAGYGGLFAGLRADLWHLKLDWTDADAMPQNGTTQVTVFQPTVEVGYKLQRARWVWIFGLVNGREINVLTQGEEVGQGWITQGQFVIARKLYTIQSQTR